MNNEADRCLLHSTDCNCCYWFLTP